MEKLPNGVALEKIIGRLGYRKLTDRNYDLDATVACKYFAPDFDIEHFLYFNNASDGGVSGSFGMRDVDAHEFSVQMLTRYGGRLYANLRGRVMSTHTFLRFQLANFVDRTGLFHWNDAIDANQIGGFLEQHLIPFVHSVRRRSDLLALLAADDWPCPWIKGNSAARAAQLAFLAVTLGQSREIVVRALASKERLILNSLSSEVDAANYISSILRESHLQ